MSLLNSKKMSNKDKAVLSIMVLVGVMLIGTLLLFGADFAVLNPKGPIAAKERDLIVTASLLSLIVIIPVFALTFGIVWKYRESNKKAAYTPDWDGSRILETIWWGVPLILIIILSAMIYKSSHELDPFQPLQASKKPLTVRVVALQWKWLFIYPEQNIATVNYLQFPEDTPINFEITSDAPMNSFWIPSLGGQIYAMAGMTTKLHLLADEQGDYKGSSANISGEGFAGMKFVAKASSESEFDNWVQNIKSNSTELESQQYNLLAMPSKDNPPAYYAGVNKDLYDTILAKYVGPGPHKTGGH